MAKKTADPLVALRRQLRDRLGDAVTYAQMIGDSDIEIGNLAEHLERLDIKAGANIEPLDQADYHAVCAALPKELRGRLVRYTDGLDGRSMYYAEAGYELGLAVARELNRLSGGAR